MQCSVDIGGGVRRNPGCPDYLVSQYDPHIRTLYDVFWTAVRESPDLDFVGTCTGAGQVQYLTFAETGAQVRSSAAGLQELVGSSRNVGIYSKNCVEWLIAEQACFARNLVTVPLYDTLGPESTRFICEQCQIEVVFTTSDKVNSLEGLVRVAIIMDDVDVNSPTLKVVPLRELLSKQPIPDVVPKPEDVFTICYTSGTTGMPKGAVLSHANLLANVSAIMSMAGRNPHQPMRHTHFTQASEVEQHLSYLPLAHIFERLVTHFVIALKSRIGFYSGDVTRIVEDAKAVNPSGFICVPRVCSRIQERVLMLADQASLLKRTLFRMAFRTKLDKLVSENRTQHWLWDWLIFNAIKNRLGTSCRFIISGAAPLPPSVMQFMRVAFPGVDVYEGYGQTETCAGSFYTFHGDWGTAGHVGGPFPCCEFKLVDVPEMEYYSRAGRGEVCIRGPSCFAGYYKDAEKTKETLDEEGWVHTGDVGSLDEEGRLHIIDRKKNLFKLAQGEYVAPEHVENILLKSPLISQIFIHGDPQCTATVALIIPTAAALEHADALPTKLAIELESFGKNGSKALSSLEIPRAVYVETTPWTVESGILTPTMKVKRGEVRKRYASVFTELCVRASNKGDLAVIMSD